MYKFIDKEFSQKVIWPATWYPEDYALVWSAYVHFGSFVTYLIEEYGLEQFEKVYNHSDLNLQLIQIYGKDLEELESDWLEYIDSNYNKLNEKQLNAYFHYYKKAMADIDEDYFNGE